MIKRVTLSLFLLFGWFSIFSQDTAYVRRIIDTLTSPSMHGRGYVFQGIQTAAAFLEEEFRSIGLKTFGDSYQQPLSYPVNTFPGKMNLEIKGRKLIPGKDWVVEPSSPPLKGTFKTIFISDLPYLREETIMPINTKGKLIVLRQSDWKNINKVPKVFFAKINSSSGVIVLGGSKPVWGVGGQVDKKPLLKVDSMIFPKDIKKATVEIESSFLNQYPTANIIGYIEGKTYPDSFIVIGAHYDHLGRMGSNTFFPGANDNASGVAMMLDLARSFTKPENKPDLSLVFIAFTGEEAGLHGSSYFADNPLFPLKKIRFVLNLDLMGNGDDGLMVVNGSIFEKEFTVLETINREKELLKTIGKRGEAANSDHYPFYKKGVPAFFLYTMGGKPDYHNPFDVSSNLTLLYYPKVYELVRELIKYLDKN